MLLGSNWMCNMIAALEVHIPYRHRSFDFSYYIIRFSTTCPHPSYTSNIFDKEAHITLSQVHHQLYQGHQLATYFL